MSRITGLIPLHAGIDAKKLLRTMMDAQRPAAGGQDGLWQSQEALFAWTGQGQGNGFQNAGQLSVMDGHIFNAEELGTATDAEILAENAGRSGWEDTLKRINGDFAAAFYDSRTQELWLGRDRFGVSPLYYSQTKDFFAFASRPAALLCLPGITRQINRRFAALFAGTHYRTFDNDPLSSPYKDVFQLPAASALLFKNGSAQIKRYWDLREEPDLNEPEARLAERYRELLLDSVKIRLRRAGRTAFTLSGGMDSSSVLASAVHLNGKKQQAFSTVYADKTYDETAEIRSMLQNTVEKWHAVQIGKPDVFSLIEEMVRLHDEPVATATWLSHYLLCREAAAQGFESLFGGLGGDELNAGEYEHFFFFFADLRASQQEDKLKTETEKWMQYHDHPIFRKDFSVMEDGLKRLADPGRPGGCLPDLRRMLRYAPALRREYFDLSSFRPVMDHPFKSHLKNRTYQDIFRETIPCCLRAEDRQSSAFGLRHFLPFFDHRLVEFMFRVPGELKIRQGITKHLLRLAMQGVLPEETRTRIKKTGWNAPAHVWFSGAEKGMLLDMIRSKSFRAAEIYDIRELERLIEEHDVIVSTGEPRDNHMMFLWQLVNLETWLRQAHAEPPARTPESLCAQN